MPYQYRRVVYCLQLWTMTVLCIGSIDSTGTTSSPMSVIDKHPYTEYCTHQISNMTTTKLELIDVCLCMYNCRPEWFKMDETIANYARFTDEQTSCTAMTTAAVSRFEHVGNMYRIVDKCHSEYSCYHFKVATWGSLYPVYSNTTDTIYLNYKCAHCNNDTEIITWQIEVNCPVSSLLNPYISERFTLALYGALQQDTGCSFRFLPPEQVNLTLKLCFRVMDMYVLKTEKIKKEYERLCGSLETAYQYIGENDRRISCILCSNVTEYIHEMMCDFGGGNRSPVVPISYLLATKDIAILFRESKHPLNVRVRGCRVYEVAERETRRCREIRCPEGQIKLGGNCKYVSSDWKAGPFVSFLRLEPVSKADMFAMEHIGELIAYKGKFFRNNLRSWSRNLYYYTPNNQTRVKYFVLKLSHKKDRIKPAVFFENFRTALKSPWILNIAGKKHQYKASIHKYFEYNICDGLTTVHKSGSHIVPKRGNRNQPCFPLKDERSEYLTFIRDEKHVSSHLEIGLTAFFFCQHVDLKPSEYSVLGNHRMVYFNVSGRILESAEFQWHTNRYGNQSISVCMSTFGTDFWQVHNEGSYLKTHFIHINAIVIILLVC